MDKYERNLDAMASNIVFKICDVVVPPGARGVVVRQENNDRMIEFTKGLIEKFATSVRLDFVLSLIHPTQRQIYEYATENDGVISVPLRDLGKSIGVDNPQLVNHHLRSLVEMGLLSIDVNLPLARKTKTYRATNLPM